MLACVGVIESSKRCGSDDRNPLHKLSDPLPNRRTDSAEGAPTFKCSRCGHVFTAELNQKPAAAVAGLPTASTTHHQLQHGGNS
jgi:hypothetical protein